MRFIYKLLILKAILLISSCTGAFAEKAEEAVKNSENEAMGVIREFGPSVTSKVGLVESDDKTRFLCRDSFSKKLSRLVNLTVQVSGEFNKTKKCLSGKSYVIQKMPSGRDAVVGKVKFVKKEYFIELANVREDKKEFRFRNLPKGLKSYKNQKVIIDAVPVSGDAGYYKVVSYMKHP